MSSVLHVPTLTCFIPSLDAGHPFRLSIHSWDPPKMSKLMAYLKPSPDRVAFETKLYFDGQLRSQKLMPPRKPWPEVIGKLMPQCGTTITDPSRDMTGTPWTEYPQPLTFPPFHPEILQQAHWDAADGLGRIKLVISEGLTQVDAKGEIINYNKLRDIVAFSFQHAPREILEKTKIAWPNAAMFQKASTPLRQPNSIAHGHSPQRHLKQTSGRAVWKPILDPATDWSLRQPRREDDPFIGPAQSSIFRTSRQVTSDDSMSQSRPPRNQSEMSDIKMQQPDFQQQVNRAAIDEIVRALTPRKRAALLNALSPPDLPNMIVNRPKAAPHDRIISVKAFDPTIRPRSATGSLQRSSDESRRSTSGNSTVMSWDETPTLGDLWPNSNGKNDDFPGLLPSIQSSTRSDGSSDNARRRKRSPSPQGLLPQAGDAFAKVMKDMSTSPCKKSPTPAKRARVEDLPETADGNNSSVNE